MGRVRRSTAVAGAAALWILVGCGGGPGDQGGAPSRGSTTSSTAGRSAPSTTVLEPIVGAQPTGPDAPSAEEIEMGVRGVIRDQHGTRDRADDSRVPGVRVEVTSESGQVVGEAVSDTEGTFGVTVEASGSYFVSLEEDDLPEGAVTPGTAIHEVHIGPGERSVALYSLRRPD